MSETDDVSQGVIFKSLGVMLAGESRADYEALKAERDELSEVLDEKILTIRECHRKIREYERLIEIIRDRSDEIGGGYSVTSALREIREAVSAKPEGRTDEISS